LRWIDKIVSIYGDKVQIVLCGVSMGGSTVVAAAGMNPPPQVKCVIDDCGFSSQVDVYAAHIGKLPQTLGLLPLYVGARLVHGYSIKDADITTLAKNMTVPALFIHGEADKFVPMSLGQKLYDSCSSENKRLFTVPDAAHALAYATDRTAYTDVFNAFIDEYVDGCEFVFDSNSLIPEAPAEEPKQDTSDGDPDTSEQSSGSAPVATEPNGDSAPVATEPNGDSAPDENSDGDVSAEATVEQ
ncbi:MAG: lysophospholipase, partial [Clostridiales bacterium]|nr:lysophospholipase [Clostridiales bacterium]